MPCSVQLGRDSIIGFTQVSSTAEVAGTGPAEQIFVDSFSFKRDEPEEDIDELIGDRAPRRHVSGPITCNGSFTRSIDPLKFVS